MNPGEPNAETIPTVYTSDTNVPINVPGTPKSHATSGAAAGTDNIAIVANVCTANVAANGHIGIARNPGSTSPIPAHPPQSPPVPRYRLARGKARGPASRGVRGEARACRGAAGNDGQGKVAAR